MGASPPQPITTFSPVTAHPSDEEYFGDATVVMVPKEPALERDYYDGYYRIYHPALLERYRLAAESESWRLYELK